MTENPQNHVVGHIYNPTVFFGHYAGSERPRNSVRGGDRPELRHGMTGFRRNPLFALSLYRHIGRDDTPLGSAAPPQACADMSIDHSASGDGIALFLAPPATKHT